MNRYAPRTAVRGNIPALAKHPAFVAALPPPGRPHVNLDIGGGPDEDFTLWLAERGVTNVVFDPGNRTPEQNAKGAGILWRSEADTVTVANVLNVIRDPNDRDAVIERAATALKRGGAAFFQIYEGDRSDQARVTTRGWQENRRTSTYLAEILRWFAHVRAHGNVIVARGPFDFTRGDML